MAVDVVKEGKIGVSTKYEMRYFSGIYQYRLYLTNNDPFDYDKPVVVGSEGECLSFLKGLELGEESLSFLKGLEVGICGRIIKPEKPYYIRN